MSHSNPTKNAPHTHGGDPAHETHTIEELHQTLHEHDEWFRHSASEPHHQEAHGGTSAGIILGFLIGTLLVVGGTSYGVFVLWERMTDALVVEMQERRTPIAPLLSARAEWAGQLARFEAIAGSPGRARVPLEVAMRLVIEDYRKNTGR